MYRPKNPRKKRVLRRTRRYHPDDDNAVVAVEAELDDWMIGQPDG